MSNMAYCRFGNTKIDLDDCLDFLDSGEYDISADEIEAGKYMFDSFLRFCADNGIIDGWNSAMIDELFDKYNKVSKANF